jgi:hypothetical protein
MVPVRKPGRPLSACPHPRDQSCGCGSVTAAIPRKQTCHCGSNTASQSQTQHTVPRPADTSPTEVPSPTRATFKVQKSARPQSSRKQSFDPINFERMDMNSVNVVQFEQRLQNIPIGMSNGYVLAGPPQMYSYVPQYANIQPQYSHVPMQPPPAPLGLNGTIPHPGGMNGFSNAALPHNGLEQAVESPLNTPNLGKNDSEKATNGVSSCCAPKSSPKLTPEANATTNGDSCCGTEKKGHSHSSSSSSIPEEFVVGSCCSSKSSQQVLKRESISSNSTPASMTPQMPQQMLPQAAMPFNPVLYPQYLPQTTVFTYPPTYGSFQNPVQPYAWRQSIRNNDYGQPQAQVPAPGPLQFDAPLVPETMDTIHTCNCGDTCQCIGCAAHPYNNATQEYVRSAWASMNLEQPPNEIYANGQTTTNGAMPVQSQTGDSVSSPTAHTPASTNSGNGEEQSLSAADFFFVNYPFTSEGCGGDTQSCPCGDDCECLGCTIHRQPGMPCGGEKNTCPCGDSCACIGCTIHNVGLAI